MRIISKYRDYYDSALGFMQDPDLIYQRTCVERQFPAWAPGEAILDLMGMKQRTYFEPTQVAIVGFCGNLYPKWIDPDFELSVETLTCAKSKSLVISSEDAAIDWSQAAKAECEHLSRQAFSDQYGPEVLASELQKRLERASVISTVETFIALKTPCFLAVSEAQRGRHRSAGYRIWSNPRLALLDMQRNLDPFTTFQEISMFLGNQLATIDESQRTTGGDRIVADSKGFDDQSFRTASLGERKERRRQIRVRKKQD